ncbi:MAG TPA: peptide-methionine (S)-S-oxide reductase MsrA [Methylomirabilota bacterium]|nr:peptide-methionine (S)-S-oxide reductase MsrA [Methylomirabilota bacterium]
MTNQQYEIATFAGGCFWCTEAVFKRLKGVFEVTPGYTGGTTPDPDYEKIHSDNTGYAEGIQITFDPNIISYEQLLDVFWATHDPTSLNRQEYDEGTEYRSAIFYHDDQQKKDALASQKRLEQDGTYKKPIVTEIVPFKSFYPAEDEHKDYYEKYRYSTYCRVIIDPKIKKLMTNFKDEVKNEYK